MKNFEDFLEETHMAQYLGTDDDAPDDYDKWYCELTEEELADYETKYMKIVKLSEPH